MSQRSVLLPDVLRAIRLWDCGKKEQAMEGVLSIKNPGLLCRVIIQLYQLLPIYNDLNEFDDILQRHQRVCYFIGGRR